MVAKHWNMDQVINVDIDNNRKSFDPAAALRVVRTEEDVISAKERNVNTGYIALRRTIIDHAFFTKKPFDEFHALIWLVLNARYKQGKTSQYIDGKLITWCRGQLPASVRFLMNAFGWRSTDTVNRWLNKLVSLGTIKRHTNQGQTVIELIHYEGYNKSARQTEQQTEHEDSKPESTSAYSQNRDQNTKENDIRTPTEHQPNETVNKVSKGVNKVNNKEMEDAKPPSFKKLTESEFYDSIKVFVNEYPEEMLESFYNYWSEKNEKGKMRFQLNNTWELKKRLITWRAKKFNNGTHQQSFVNGQKAKSSGESKSNAYANWSIGT